MNVYLRHLAGTGDFLQYPVTLLCVALEFAAIAWRACFRGSAPPPQPRAASDLTWFVPVFVWGIESLRHGLWWIYEAPFRGIAAGPHLLVLRAGLTCIIMVAVLLACFLAEYLADRVGCAGREPQATLPLPVFAAVLGVQWAWGVLLLGFTVSWL